jgi:hypothetical protein
MIRPWCNFFNTRKFHIPDSAPKREHVIRFKHRRAMIHRTRGWNGQDPCRMHIHGNGMASGAESQVFEW